MELDRVQPDVASMTVKVTDVLAGRGLRVASAESCSGGRIAAALTSRPGSSAWFDCGCVVYSNAAKVRLLGVEDGGLAEHGAVSCWTVEAMCRGLLECSSADLVVATSGIAGPDGGSSEKPVGTVCLGWQRRGAAPRSACLLFAGDREQVISQTVVSALEGLLEEAGRHAPNDVNEGPG